MFFTDYVVLDRAASTVDSLGFMRPASVVADNLFKQFTVLSNHPAYHGFLCFAFALFAEGAVKPDSPDLAPNLLTIATFG